MTEYEMELLENSAIAVGYDHISEHSDGLIYAHTDSCEATLWNPLENSGQCFDLAASQGISIVHGYCLDDAPIVTCYGIWPEECSVTLPCFPNPMKQVRLCILMAVVEEYKFKIELDKELGL